MGLADVRGGWPSASSRTCCSWRLMCERFRVWLKSLLLPRRVPVVCQFATRYPGYDFHDYHVAAGGDGTPTHFYTYTCWNCGKRFTI